MEAEVDLPAGVDGEDLPLAMGAADCVAGWAGWAADFFRADDLLELTQPAVKTSANKIEIGFNTLEFLPEISPKR